MQWITANTIHDGHRFLSQKTFIGIQDGKIQAITNQKPSGQSIMEYDGILTPGFVNAHCHLELSHMAGLLPRNTGLPTFLYNVVTKRNTIPESEKLSIIKDTLDTCYNAGTIAFGDICNTTDTIQAKVSSKLYFHNFIEAIGKLPARAETAMATAINTFKAFESASNNAPQRMYQSIVPHAPYSVSDTLMQAINAYDPHHTISIHSQEHAEEDALFLNGTGAFVDFLAKIGITANELVIYGEDAITWLMTHISDTHPLLLVHNTHMSVEQIAHVQQAHGNAYYCLCPQSNLYIEQQLPNVPQFVAHQVRICIGTDSLASNDRLDMLAELNCIKSNFDDISWEQLLHWATYEGACALALDTHVGSIAIGKVASFALIDTAYQHSKMIAF